MHKLLILTITGLIGLQAHSTIIRGESRERVHRPSKKELNGKVGLLKAWNNREPNLKAHCTGTVISEDYILTAAHCVVDPATGKLYQNVEFHPRFNEVKKLYKATINEGWIIEEYLEESKRLAFKNDLDVGRTGPYLIQNDIALLKGFVHEKDIPVGIYAGTKSYWYNEDFKEYPYTHYDKIYDMMLISYPGDKPYGTMWTEECYAQTSDYSSSYPAIGITTCDTYKGASGSAILQYSEKYEDYYAMGVFSADTENKNYFTWFTHQTFKDIHTLIKKIDRPVVRFKKVKFKTKK